MNINKDYIVGSKFRNICDHWVAKRHCEHQYAWKKNDAPLPDKKVMSLYCEGPHTSKDLDVLLDFISIHPDRQFILVTHNSDSMITKVELPSNIKKWFALNVEFDHDNIIPIPIGLENHTHVPYKQQLIDFVNGGCACKFCDYNKDNPRKPIPLAAFYITHWEREDLNKLISDKKIDAYVSNTPRYDEYLHQLAAFDFCLCPRGNGVDTHRIWEALYMGCIPIVKNHHTHSTIKDLPIMFIDHWEEVNQYMLHHIKQKFKQTQFNFEKLNFQFWKDWINTEKELLEAQND